MQAEREEIVSYLESQFEWAIPRRYGQNGNYIGPIYSFKDDDDCDDAVYGPTHTGCGNNHVISQPWTEYDDILYLQSGEYLSQAATAQDLKDYRIEWNTESMGRSRANAPAPAYYVYDYD